MKLSDRRITFAAMVGRLGPVLLIALYLNSLFAPQATPNQSQQLAHAVPAGMTREDQSEECLYRHHHAIQDEACTCRREAGFDKTKDGIFWFGTNCVCHRDPKSQRVDRRRRALEPERGDETVPVLATGGANLLRAYQENANGTTERPADAGPGILVPGNYTPGHRMAASLCLCTFKFSRHVGGLVQQCSCRYSQDRTDQLIEMSIPGGNNTVGQEDYMGPLYSEKAPAWSIALLAAMLIAIMGISAVGFMYGRRGGRGAATTRTSMMPSHPSMRHSTTLSQLEPSKRSTLSRHSHGYRSNQTTVRPPVSLHLAPSSSQNHSSSSHNHSSSSKSGSHRSMSRH